VPRAPRIEYPGAIHHVTSRGVLRAAIFRADEDWSVFVATLATVTTRNHWQCLAYCLMPNHYHLLVATPEPTLSQGMQELNGAYATRFNTAHDRIGHVFERRYRSELIRRDGHLLEAARYIVLNPVRAAIVASPQDWMWSSYRATVERARRPTWLAVEPLLRLFGSVMGYREFVLTGATSQNRPPLKDLLDASTPAQVASAVDAYGYTQAAVARHLGVSQPTVSRLVRAGRGAS
jgi:putative transposase